MTDVPQIRITAFHIEFVKDLTHLPSVLAFPKVGNLPYSSPPKASLTTLMIKTENSGVSLIRRSGGKTQAV